MIEMNSRRGRDNLLIVQWDGRHVGNFTLDRNGAMQFRYSEHWLEDGTAPHISFSLPKRTDAFSDRECKPFFENLLPEHWQREAAARALGVSSGNPFRLLEALAGDTAGACTLISESLERAKVPDEIGQPVPLSNAELSKLIERFAQVPMLAGQSARYSLAGAQSKLPVVLVDNRIALAVPGQATTHIMKPEPARFPGLAANEAFCMTLARRVGLDAAEAEWRSLNDRPFALVKRYDRTIQNGQVRQLHQEDFAQGLGVLSSKKYASDGGPVFRDCFSLVRRAASDPDDEVLKLIDAAFFNLIIGNADAHAKNFSLLRKAGGNVVLAPLYDLVSTVIWPSLSPRFAMKYGGAKSLEDISAGSLKRFTADVGVDLEIVKTRGSALCERILQTVEAGCQVPEPSDQTPHAHLAGVIHNRAARASIKLAY